MADEIIVIEIQEKIDRAINVELLRIHYAAILASKGVLTLSNAIITLSQMGPNLSAAMVKAALATNQLAISQNKVAISAQKLQQEQIKTQIAAIALTRAQANLATAQTRGQTAAQQLANSQLRNAVITQQLSTATNQASLSQVRLQRAQSQTVQTSSILAGVFKRLAMAVGAYLSIREVIELGNAYVGLQNKLKVVTDSQEQLSVVSKNLFDISNRTRGPIEETAAAFSRFDLALKPLGKSQAEVLRMTETINKAMVISGATAGEQAAGLLQLSQAFNKGKLDGDEFRSVMELMPSVADAIAKQMKVTRGELLLLAPQGKITAEVMSKALVEASIRIDAAFAKTVPTISQSLTVLRNNTISVFGEIEKSSGILSSISAKVTEIGSGLGEFAGTSAVLVTNLVNMTTSLFSLAGQVVNANGELISLKNTMNGLSLIGAGLTTVFDTMKLSFSIDYEVEPAQAKVDLLTESIDTFNKKIKEGRGTDRDVESLAALSSRLPMAQAELKIALNKMNEISQKDTPMDKLADDLLNVQEATKKFNETQAQLKPLNDIIADTSSKYSNIAESIEKADREGKKFSKPELAAKNKELDSLRASYEKAIEKKNLLMGISVLRQSGISNKKPVIDKNEVKNEATRAHTLAKINAELDKETGSLQRLTPEREIFARMTEIEIQLANKKLAGKKFGIKADEDELAKIKAKITANEQEKKIAEERNKIYNESIAPAQNYNNTVSAASQLLSKNLITQDEYNKQLLIANETYASLTNPMYEFNKQIEQEGYLLGFTGMQLEVENRLMQLRNKLVSNGVKDVEVSLLLERKTIEALVLKNRVTQESQNLMSSLGMTVEEFKIKQLSLNEAMAKVSDPGQKAALTVAAFSEILSATQLGLDAELAMYKKHQEEIDKLLKDGVITKKVTKQAEFNLSETYNEKERAKKIQFLSNMASLANSSNRELFEIGKAAAVAQATYEGYLAVQKALNASGNTMVNIALAASVGVMTANNIAGIMNTKMAGYESGGFTGMGGTSQVAGVVHGQEFVMNAASTAKNRPILEAMNRGGSIPSVGKGGAQILIQNYGTSKTFEVEQLDENRYRVIARDEANQAIRRELPALNASEIGNANSRTSRALSQHTTVGRRNG